ncbi:hypothetical protein SEA_KARDASHIAN_55 [Streptomyces phage Kardashian]|nr:hypothetical protein SEA_KARDASHIAN_55 [Streptomyces phage Kardashian]
MNVKSLARRTTAKMGKQIMVVKAHSPSLLVGAGVVSVVGSVVLACRATLKLNDVLEKAEDELREFEPKAEGELKKKTFGVQLQTAIEIAKLYAPSAVLLTAGISAIAGSHAILKKRNAGLAAAYTVIDQQFKGYRKRVVADQGAEKDHEYFTGVEEREVVKDTKDGPVVEKVKGVDQEALLNADPETTYARVFHGPILDDDGVLVHAGNKHWSTIPNQNQFTLQMIQSELNDLLRLQGYVFLNQAYDLLGFEPTAAGQIVGWKRNPEDGKGDGFISFGVWQDGVYRGTQWLNGDRESIKLDFNVDGPIIGALPKV